MKKEQLHNLLHFIMALIGGFLGAYTLLNNHQLFGNAQTANLIGITMNLVGRDFSELLLRLCVLFSFIFGLFCTVMIREFTKIDRRLCAILIDICADLLLCILPQETNDFLAICPVAFATSFQWNSFTEIDGFNSSTIFSTNNLRQFTTSLFEYLCDKDKSHLRKAKAFGGTLLFYHVGVAISFIMYLSLGSKAGWFCLIPGVIAIVLLSFEKEWFTVSVRSAELS